MSGDNLFCKTCGSHHHAASECQHIDRNAEIDKLRTEQEASKQREENLKQSIEATNDIIDKLDDEIKAKDERIAELEAAFDSERECSKKRFHRAEELEQRIANAPHDADCPGTYGQPCTDVCWKLE